MITVQEFHAQSMKLLMDWGYVVFWNGYWIEGYSNNWFLAKDIREVRCFISREGKVGYNQEDIDDNRSLRTPKVRR